MCQLSVVSLGKKDLNLLANYLLSFKESKIHSDGFGVIYQGDHAKTDLAPINLLDFGEFVSDTVKGHYPIYSHIRLASQGVDVCKDNSHPFESQDFLLMHNGTLVKGGEKRSYVKGQESDSKMFLDLLQEEFNKDSNFIESMNRAMATFWGKFAFLIYCKPERTYYIIRGTSALLHKTNLLNEADEPIGFMINTDRENLLNCMMQIKNISQILYKQDLKFSIPALLDSESIFKASTTNVEKVGTVKENDEKLFIKEEPKKAIVPENWWNRYNKNYSNISDDSLFDDAEDTFDHKSADYKICQYMIKHLMTPKDIALLFKLYLQIDILSATEEDKVLFAGSVIPKISANASRIKFLEKQFKDTKVFPVLLYSDYGLEFPWPLNNEQVVTNAVKLYQKDMDKKRHEKLN